MQNKYADIIIDITNENVDRPFTYIVPDTLRDRACPGMPVRVPFGNGDRPKTGYILSLRDTPPEGAVRLKEILGPAEKQFSAEADLLRLAVWMHLHYGCMLNQALKTVLPVKTKVGVRASRYITAVISLPELAAYAEEKGRKHHTAQQRLAEALVRHNGTLPFRTASRQLGVGTASIRAMVSDGAVRVTEGIYPGEKNAADIPAAGLSVTLNEAQAAAVGRFIKDQEQGIRGRYLLYGVTGSGKTEVYAEMIREVLKQGRQAILLIPEISLTFQTVARFERIFGKRVAIIHSRLSKGERYDQFRRAAEGKADILIGPRSAVFAPFRDPGIIIIDEEHDGAYKNDTVPRYETRDVAEARAGMHNAALVLGSATPSSASFQKAAAGEYTLLTLPERAVEGARPAATHVVDLRKELAEGNRSVFSRELKRLIDDRLLKKEQTILFMNRRGYSNFVSCRSCGNAVRCPHCDVTLTLHTGGRLVCHYCGYTIPLPKNCPDCGSPYIAGFGTGTQKLEELTKAAFPEARVLRMDADAAAGKNAGGDILKTFAGGGADILIGTQMVVKGHDFPNVTLVGIMAADTELYVPDYRSAERTFQLLVQAAGRAGRGKRPGDVVIQTYRPEHYAVSAAAAQDYRMFFKNEMAYREAGGYPPAVRLLTIQCASRDEALLTEAAGFYAGLLGAEAEKRGAVMIGPVNAGVYKVHDYFRKLIYIKHRAYDILLSVKKETDAAFRGAYPAGVSVLFDFS